MFAELDRSLCEAANLRTSIILLLTVSFPRPPGIVTPFLGKSHHIFSGLRAICTFLFFNSRPHRGNASSTPAPVPGTWVSHAEKLQ
jgi:hypothetical protein